jgi:hypothetical protein
VAADGAAHVRDRAGADGRDCQAEEQHGEVGSAIETRWDTVGCYGKEVSFIVKSVVNGDVHRGDKRNAEILNACIGALHFQDLTVTNHRHAGTRYEMGGEPFTELVSGVKVRHMPSTFRVFVTQST